MDIDGNVILTNINYNQSLTKPIESIPQEPETKHTLTSIMHKDTEGIKLSRSKLSLATPKKIKSSKKKKKDKKSKDK